MKYRIALSSLFLFFWITVSAQSNLPDHMTYETLGNGLEVLMIEDRSVPLVTIELAVKNGSFREPPEANGLAHLYENLFFTAHPDLTSEELFEARLNEMGIVYNSTTGEERVNYTINLGSHLLSEGLSFVASAVKSPVFSESDIEREQAVMRSTFQQAESNPVHFLIMDVNKKLWGEYWSRKNPLGRSEVVFNAKPRQLQSMHERFYTADNSLLIISGDIDRGEAMRAVKSAFSGWKPRSSELDELPVPEFKALSASEAIITTRESAENPILLTALLGPNTRNDRPGSFAAEVLSYMLSQRAAQLQKVLVEKELAYHVSVGYTNLKYGAPLTIFMVPKPQAKKAAIAALEEDIKQWANPDYFTDEQIKEAKRMLIIQEKYSREVASDIVHNISYWWASADINYFTNYTSAIEAVSREEIARVVKEYIHGKPNVTGLLLNQQLKQSLGINTIEPLNTEQL